MDGSSYNQNNFLQIGTLDDSPQTMQRIQEATKLLQTYQGAAQIEQAKSKLAQLRDDSKIWFTIHAPKFEAAAQSEKTPDEESPDHNNVAKQ